MNWKVLFIIFPIFVIHSLILVFLYIVELESIILGLIIAIISIIPATLLFKWGIQSSQSHFKNISKRTVNVEEVEITLEDGIQTFGKIYRSSEESRKIENGFRYQEPRKAIIMFHGFYANKEINEKFLIPLAHLGYISIAFDQRGHGEAGGKKSDWTRLYNDVEAILKYVCSLKDVNSKELICIGISMGGTSVLTKCYEDERVAMVIAISTLHDVENYLEAKSSILSSRWFIKLLISRAKEKNPESLNLTAHHYLKRDPEFNKNRVYLIHGEDDKIFPPSLTFQLNKKQAHLPDNHAILLDDCRHNIAGQELLILSIILKWIREYEKKEKKEK